MQTLALIKPDAAPRAQEIKQVQVQRSTSWSSTLLADLVGARWQQAAVSQTHCPSAAAARE